MPGINQLSKTSSLGKGDQILVAAPNPLSNSYPAKSSLWQLIQFLSTGVFQYLTVEDFISVPGVPVAELPTDAPAGARAFVTDASQNDITRPLTVGLGPDGQFGFQSSYGDGSPFGEMADATFYPNGAAIAILWWIDSGLLDGLYLGLAGQVANAGWTSITINGDTFTRTSASYSYDDETNLSIWNWNPASNPFGSVGDVNNVLYSFTGFQFNAPVFGGAAAALPVFYDGDIWRIG